MRGTLGSYAALFIHQARTRRGLGTPATWVLFLYVFCSVAGRFGVAFLGFAFNLEDSPVYTPALLRPNWEGGTVNGDGSHDAALTALLGNSFQSKG